MTTEVIVTQSNNTSIVQEQLVNRVVTDDKPARIITSGMMPPPAVNSLTNSLCLPSNVVEYLLQTFIFFAVFGLKDGIFFILILL